MGWANCGKDSRGRNIGYGWRGQCDHKGCKERIDRGLAYACGGMHGDSDTCPTTDNGICCEGYFCGKHMTSAAPDGRKGPVIQVCIACEKLNRPKRSKRTPEEKQATSS